jgi:hypothetical protein
MPPKKILNNEKARSAPAEFGAMAKAIRAASLSAQTSEAWLFLQQKEPLVKLPTSPWSMEKPLQQRFKWASRAAIAP